MKAFFKLAKFVFLLLNDECKHLENIDFVN